MRAWYGKGRYWFVVAASAGAGTAWGWYGYAGRWESLGREFIDWHGSDFAQAIAFSDVPAELIESLAKRLDGLSSTRATDGLDIDPPWFGPIPATSRPH